MTPVLAFNPEAGQNIEQAIAEARRIARDIRQKRVYVIFNEIPVPVEADNDVEIDELWRRHMKLREDAHR